MRLWDTELAALDFETTGLSHAGGDRVVEVAVVRGRYGETPRVWTSLVSPGRPVGATHVHGITEAMLAGAPRFPDVAPALFAALDGAVVVAHNARFDVGFLNMECTRAALSPPEVPVVDSLGLARRVLTLSSYSLDSIVGHLGVSRARAHRAADDATATWQVAWSLFDRADPERALDVDGARALCRRRGSADLRAVMERLQQAIALASPVEIEYHSARVEGGPVRRAITPVKVTTTRVEAFCHLRNETRVFRLDRIKLIPEA